MHLLNSFLIPFYLILCFFSVSHQIIGSEELHQIGVEIAPAFDVGIGNNDFQSVEKTSHRENEKPLLDFSKESTIEPVLEPQQNGNIFLSAQVVSKIFNPISLDDAIVSTIYRQIEIKIAQLNIAFQRGGIQAASGPFDPIFDDIYIDRAINDQQIFSYNLKSHLKASTFNNAFSATKTTRLGSIFTVRSDLERTNSLP